VFGIGGAAWLPLGPWFLHAALTFCSLFSPILAGPAQFPETMPLAKRTPDFDTTLYQRRAFFGYTYTGPLGPIEALSPAGQVAMLADQAEEAALVGDYGM
jgi:hypothetical protein